MGNTMSLFDEKYRVVDVQSDHLLVQGVKSGDVLTIRGAQVGPPLSEENYRVGQLIALSDPARKPPN